MVGDFTIRGMTLDDLKWAVDLAASEGWEPGLNDAEAFFKAAPEGFLVGLKGGRPIACASAVSYGSGKDDKFGFMGFLIVLPEYRGHRYGLDIAYQAMNMLSGHNIGVDGVLSKYRQYQKYGFKYAYQNIRFCHIVGENPELCGETIPLDEVSFEKICAYDRRFFPAEREKFLRSWLEYAPVKLAYMKSGELAGFAVARPSRNGYRIGPLFAGTPETAKKLFNDIQAKILKGSKLYIDVPELNGAAVMLAREYNMEKVFGTARMYSLGTPEIDIDGVYGITSYELG